MPKKATNAKVTGLGGMSIAIKSAAFFKIRVEDKDILIKALVVKNVTGKTPAVPRDVIWEKDSINLADPFFNKAARISVLLGSNVLPKFFLPGVEIKNGYLLQNTILGWIASGPCENVSQNQRATMTHVTSSYVTMSEIEEKLLAFWDIPVTGEVIDEAAEDYCENLFQKKHFRTAEGRYVVPIPFKPSAPALGDSYTNALRHYLGQEKKWSKEEKHKELSNNFMKNISPLVT